MEVAAFSELLLQYFNVISLRLKASLVIKTVRKVLSSMVKSRSGSRDSFS